MTVKGKPSYDYICFSELVYEFDDSVRKNVETKIKRRLKYYAAGAFDAERADLLRGLKKEMYAEITSGCASPHFKKTDSPYTVLADFDTAGMAADYCAKYPAVAQEDMAYMVQFAVYLFYTR